MRGAAAIAVLLSAVVHVGRGASPDRGVHCADPAVIPSPSGKTVYAFGTGAGIPFWRSTDLRDWERCGRVFRDAVPAWASAKVPKADGIWAPDISMMNGRYHLYYAVSSWGSQRSVIGLAVGRSLDPSAPEYGWEDRGSVVESAPGKTDFNAIDPALLVAADGTPYLLWGSFWSGIKAARIDPKTGKLARGAQVVSVAVRAPDVNPPAIEAPYAIRRGGFYYLFVSWGFTCKGKDSTYRVMVGRSRNPLGPYVDFGGKAMREGGGTLVLASHDRCYGPGHNSVLRTRTRDWLVHHVEKSSWNRWTRVLQLRPMYWVDGWPVVGEPSGNEMPGGRTRLAVKDFVGRWRHSVDYAVPRTVTLREDHGIAGARGRWSYENGCVVFRWPSEEAPNGMWEDRVVVAPDGRSYVGRNQNGQVIRGVKE